MALCLRFFLPVSSSLASLMRLNERGPSSSLPSARLLSWIEAGNEDFEDSFVPLSVFSDCFFVDRFVASLPVTIPVSVETGPASLSRGNNRTFGVSRSGSAAAQDAANTKTNKTSGILFIMTEKIRNNFIVSVRFMDEIDEQERRGQPRRNRIENIVGKNNFRTFFPLNEIKNENSIYLFGRRWIALVSHRAIYNPAYEQYIYICKALPLSRPKNEIKLLALERALGSAKYYPDRYISHEDALSLHLEN